MCPPCGGFGRKNEGKEAAERAAGIPPSLSFFAHRDSRRGRAAGPGRAHRGDSGDAGWGQGETLSGTLTGTATEPPGGTFPPRNGAAGPRRSGGCGELRLPGRPVPGGPHGEEAGSGARPLPAAGRGAPRGRLMGRAAGMGPGVYRGGRCGLTVPSCPVPAAARQRGGRRGWPRAAVGGGAEPAGGVPGHGRAGRHPLRGR